jgi:hypothetical protein
MQLGPLEMCFAFAWEQVTLPAAEDLQSILQQTYKNGFDIIWTACHIIAVKWAVEMADEFEPEFDALHEGVQRFSLCRWFWRSLGRSWAGPALTRSTAPATRT